MIRDKSIVGFIANYSGGVQKLSTHAEQENTRELWKEQLPELQAMHEHLVKCCEEMPVRGQAILAVIDPVYQWSRYDREDLPRQHVGLITSVSGDYVTYADNLTGKLLTFRWRLKETYDGTYNYNKLYDWQTITDFNKQVLALAAKYKQSMEQFLSDAN